MVDAASGRRRRFVCPYHAWTWDNRGALKGITHGATGFPGIDKGALGLKRLGCAEAALYWRKNHDITVRTLAEDFAIGESIQSGLASGANDELRFGRFEGALDRFNRIVEREIDAGT